MSVMIGSVILLVFGLYFFYELISSTPLQSLPGDDQLISFVQDNQAALNLAVSIGKRGETIAYDRETEKWFGTPTPDVLAALWGQATIPVPSGFIIEPNQVRIEFMSSREMFAPVRVKHLIFTSDNPASWECSIVVNTETHLNQYDHRICEHSVTRVYRKVAENWYIEFRGLDDWP